MTIQEIKALPRTEEGIFDLKKVQADAGRRNIYQAADLVYPTYAAYETTENKKEGYPDIMAQMRVLKKHACGERIHRGKRRGLHCSTASYRRADQSGDL